jgi:DNA repair protein RecO (recombination protein O)
LSDVNLQPAYILHRRDYRETSLLVEAFTVHAGRIGMVARGARRARSPLRGLLEPFTPLLLSWAARGELATLRDAEPTATRRPMPAHVAMMGLYANELLMRLLHRHDPHPELFAAYDAALTLLRDGVPPEPVLRVFEKRLLAAIGYGLVLDREAGTGAAIRHDGEYRYVPDRGPLDATRSGEDWPGVSVSGATLLALEREVLSDDQRVLRETKRLMRTLLGEHLGPRPLRTRVLLEALVTRPDRPSG